VHFCMILYLLVLFSYEIEKELSGEKLNERKSLWVLFVGFCGLCAFAFLSVGEFVRSFVLFCFAQGEGQEGKKAGVFCGLFCFREEWRKHHG
jgi:hypothetical protein